MDSVRNRRIEHYIYVGLWLLVITFYVLDICRVRYADSKPVMTFAVAAHMFVSVLPFIILFLINNLVLLPRLLFRNSYTRYFISVAVVLAAIWLWQSSVFFHHIQNHRIPSEISIHMGPRPILPLPLFMDLMYDVLIVGANLAIALMFQRFDYLLEKERLQKSNVENQLIYLKAQINPHFYMNMLNNIHGMIEINPEKAQDMVINMSNMMRYMLYDSAKPLISLSEEIGFLQNYLKVMRERYPENRVKISAEWPDKSNVKGVMVPPLLFLVFIENSFKHGISYKAESYVIVRLTVNNGSIEFECLNSVHEASVCESRRNSGIGLENVSKRLHLIYGDRYHLEVSQSASNFNVTLIIPSHENKCSDN